MGWNHQPEVGVFCLAWTFPFCETIRIQVCHWADEAKTGLWTLVWSPEDFDQGHWQHTVTLPQSNSVVGVSVAFTPASKAGSMWQSWSWVAFSRAESMVHVAKYPNLEKHKPTEDASCHVSEKSIDTNHWPRATNHRFSPSLQVPLLHEPHCGLLHRQPAFAAPFLDMCSAIPWTVPGLWRFPRGLQENYVRSLWKKNRIVMDSLCCQLTLDWKKPSSNHFKHNFPFSIKKTNLFPTQKAKRFPKSQSAHFFFPRSALLTIYSTFMKGHFERLQFKAAVSEQVSGAGENEKKRQRIPMFGSYKNGRSKAAL